MNDCMNIHCECEEWMIELNVDVRNEWKNMRWIWGMREWIFHMIMGMSEWIFHMIMGNEWMNIPYD